MECFALGVGNRITETPHRLKLVVIAITEAALARGLVEPSLLWHPSAPATGVLLEQDFSKHVLTGLIALANSNYPDGLLEFSSAAQARLPEEFDGWRAGEHFARRSVERERVQHVVVPSRRLKYQKNDEK